MVPKQSSTTTQIQKVELPPWVDQAAQNNYELANRIAKEKPTFYKGQTVAGIDPMMLEAVKGFRTDGAGVNAAYKSAGDMLKAGAAGITSLNRSKYMNPFEDSVVNSTINDSNRALGLALNRNASEATQARAFGGSRSAIIDAVTNSESVRNLTDQVAGIRRQGYNDATSAMQSDLDRKITAGGQQTALADALSKLRLSDFATKFSTGEKFRSITQQGLDDKVARFNQPRDRAIEDLNMRLSALGMSPYGKTETTNRKDTSSSSPDFAQLGAGILGLLPMLFGLSDRSEKTDIKKIGVEPVTGLNLYAYRYKGDPKTYPKVVGPMAQDIEKKFPTAVRKIAGKRIVDHRMLPKVA